MRKVLGSVAMVLGVLLLVVGVLAKPVLYKGLATVKLDQNSTSTSEGSGMSALYVHKVNGSPVYDRLVNVDLKSTRKVIGIPGRVKAAGKTDDQAFWQTGVTSQAKIDDTWTSINFSQEGVSFDRKSGTATNCCGDFKSAGDLDDPTKLVPVEHQGNFFKFPFDVQKKTYQWWDGDLGRATDIKFVREEKIEGLTTYVFRQTIDKGEVAEREVPKGVFGDSASGNVAATVMYGNIRTLWIEPNTGVLIKGQEQVEKLLVAEGYEDVATTLGTIGYSDATVKGNVEEWGGKGALLGFINGPLTPLGIGVGILLIALGVFLLVGANQTKGRRHAA